MKFLSNLTKEKVQTTHRASLKKGGFTLIETFIAITILMLSLAGPMSLAQKSLKTSLMSKDRTTANFLGQEAIEFLKTLRDTSVDWPTFTALTASCIANNTGTCKIDPVRALIISPKFSQGIPTACTGACPNLYYETNGGYYTYTQSGTTRISPYRREISLEPSGNDEIKVTVTVYFPSGQPIVLKNSIFNVPRY
jgi:Tfp pilus assembly protein PilV